MPMGLDELRSLLVDTLGILTARGWQKALSKLPDSASVLERLVRTPRFVLHDASIPFVTEYQKTEILQGRGKELVLVIGTQRWLRLQHLRTGGQGDLWYGCPCSAAAKARDLAAIKLPLNNDPANVRALQKEIDILAQIQCPCVVELLAHDTSRGIVATRLLDGPSLAKLLLTHRRLSITQTLKIGLDICQGLTSLHAKDRIHKDIKPANIIFLGGDRAVLLDFGLAEPLTAARSRGGGTPYFIAPEIYFQQTNIDVRADVYGLAATLFCLLVGQPPHFQQCLRPRHFLSENAKLDEVRFQTLDSILDCEPDVFRAEVPRELSEIIVSALCVDVSQRPKTAQEFREQLKKIHAEIHRAIKIEQELRNLFDLLLEAYRQTLREAGFPDVVQNAQRLHQNVADAVKVFPRLFDLGTQPLHLTCGMLTDQTYRQTIKVCHRLLGLQSQLAWIASGTGPLDQKKAYFTSTLEGIRDSSVSALGLSHAWLALLQLWGYQS